MRKLKDLLFTFSCVTTGSLIMAAIFISIFYEENDVNASILWQILFTSAVCCLGNFLYPQRKLTKKQLYFSHVVHYLYVVCVVIGSGLYFDWFQWTQLHMVFAMLVSITIVFVTIMYIVYEQSKRETMKINERLQEYNKTHHVP
ncbi:DUF3021 family protein [Amedibacillus sp. YH-ame10]